MRKTFHDTFWHNGELLSLHLASFTCVAGMSGNSFKQKYETPHTGKEIQSFICLTLETFCKSIRGYHDGITGEARSPRNGYTLSEFINCCLKLKISTIGMYYIKKN